MTAAEAGAGVYRPGTGIALMLAAWLLFALVDSSAKWLVLAGLPAAQLAFMRYAGHFLISLVAIGSRGPGRFAVAHPALVVLRALLLVSATTLNFFALNFLPLTVTSAIMFSAPIIVCFLSWPVLGERVGPWRWFAIALGFAGVLTVIRPFGAGFQPVALVMVYNAFALAMYSVITRRLAGRESIATQQFYLGLIGTAALAPFALADWQAPQTAPQWGLFLALGGWAWGGHELLVRAHALAPANLLMPFTYSFMLYLTAASWLIFGHLPDRWTVAGAAIIVASGLIIWVRENRG